MGLFYYWNTPKKGNFILERAPESHRFMCIKPALIILSFFLQMAKSMDESKGSHTSKLEMIYLAKWFMYSKSLLI